MGKICKEVERGEKRLEDLEQIIGAEENRMEDLSKQFA